MFIYQTDFDTEICDELLNYFKSNKKFHEAGRCGDGIDKSQKDSTDLTILPQHFSSSPISTYKKLLDSAMLSYAMQHWNCISRSDIISVVEPMVIQHYAPGGGFKEWHCERNNLDNITRHLVFMTYLNTVSEGGTDFYHQEVTIEAIKGRTVFWPSDWTHTHKGQINYKEEKFIITGWYNMVDV